MTGSRRDAVAQLEDRTSGVVCSRVVMSSVFTMRIPRRRGRTRVTLLADIGGPDTLHAGDEAMFAADLDLVRRLVPEARCVAVSADPAATSAWYGVDAVPRLSSAEVQAFGRSGAAPHALRSTRLVRPTSCSSPAGGTSTPTSP